jgi:hypothetical protein
MKRRTLLQATAASATLLAAPMIKAQTLPSGPIRIVVGVPAWRWYRRIGPCIGPKTSSHVERHHRH